MVSSGELVDQLGQRSQLPLVNQIEFLNKEYEMLETGVQMSLLAQLHHLGKVLMVNVSVHTEQSLQNCLCNAVEILWEGYA